MNSRKGLGKRKKVDNNNLITQYFPNYQSFSNQKINNDISCSGKNEKEINIKKEDNFIDLNEEDDASYNINNYLKIDSDSKEEKLYKIKMEEISNNEVDNSQINSNKNNCSNPLYFINLNTFHPDDEKRNLIFMELLNNYKIISTKLKIEPTNFQNTKDFHKSFPFLNCRILNINNISYIIGGLLKNEINIRNNLGIKNCYKLVYNQDKNEIKIFKLTSTKYEHQSHSLLYLKKYETIVCCSGYQQKNCEYLCLKNNEKENEWEKLYQLKKARANAIPLLFNEKYIFLIGGNDSEGKMNEDYNVLNYELFINNKYRSFWKTYSLKDKTFLEQKGSGIIYYNNDIFILGGYNEHKNILSWKIDFEIEKEEEKEKEKENKSMFVEQRLDKNYKISSVKLYDNITNYIKEEYDNSFHFCFCGDPVFMSYKDFLVNISFGGLILLLPNSLFN